MENRRQLLRQIVEVWYPVILYFVISLIVTALLQLYFGTGAEYFALCQGLGALATVPFLQTFYRYEVLLMVRRQEETPRTKRILCACYAMITVAIASIAVNNLIGFSKLEKLSVRYSEVTTAFYGANLWIELLFLGLVIPFCEELLYRGVVFARLKSLVSARMAIFCQHSSLEWFI